MSTMAHELHEIRGLKDVFEDMGELTSGELVRHIETLHGEALKLQERLRGMWPR